MGKWKIFHDKNYYGKNSTESIILEYCEKKFQHYFTRNTFLSILPTAVSGISSISSIILGAS